MKYAQIQDNRVHWIFESDEKPDFAPYIQIVSLDGLDEVQEGWTYKDGFFSEYIEPFENLVLAKRTEIWNAGDNILSIVKSRFTQSEIESWPKQEQGAKDIIAENLSDVADYRIYIKKVIYKNGKIISKEIKKDEKDTYKDYSDYQESIKTIKNHRILALNRGEKEKCLKVNLDYDFETIFNFIVKKEKFLLNVNKDILFVLINLSIASLKFKYFSFVC